MLTGQETLALNGHTTYFTSVAYGPSGKLIASASREGDVKIWDAITGKEKVTLLSDYYPLFPDPIHSLAFSLDGKHLLTGGDAIVKKGESSGGVRVWDVTTGKEAPLPQGQPHPVHSVAFSPDGHRFVAGGETFRANGKAKTILKIWDATTGKEVLDLQGQTGLVLSVAFSPDGKRLVSSSTSGDEKKGTRKSEVKIWDATTGKEIFTLCKCPGTVRGAIFCPDGQRVVSVEELDHTTPGKVKVWDAVTGKEVFAFATPGGNTDVAFDPTGRCLALQTRDKWGHDLIVVWDAQDFNNGTARILDAKSAVTAWHWREVAYSRPSAIFHWSRLIEAQPEQGLYYARRGLIHYAVGDLGKAVADYSSAIELKFEEWWVFAARGFAHANQKTWDQAIADYSQAIQLKPDERWLLEQRAHAQAEQGQWNKAASDYSRAIEMKPAAQPPEFLAVVLGRLGSDIGEPKIWHRHALAHLQIGDADSYRILCAKLLQRFDRARSDSTRRSELWESNFIRTCVLTPNVMDGYPEVVLWLEKKASAEIASGSKEPDRLCTLGAVLFRIGQFDKAVQWLREADNRHEIVSVRAWLFLAMAHQRLGQVEEAKKWLGKAKKWMDQTAQGKANEAAPLIQLPWDTRLELQLLRREAETLIERKEEPQMK